MKREIELPEIRINSIPLVLTLITIYTFVFIASIPVFGTYLFFYSAYRLIIGGSEWLMFLICSFVIWTLTILTFILIRKAANNQLKQITAMVSDIRNKFYDGM